MPRLRVPFTADTHDSPHLLLPGVAFIESFPYRIYNSRESTPFIVDATVTIQRDNTAKAWCFVQSYEADLKVEKYEGCPPPPHSL